MTTATAAPAGLEGLVVTDTAIGDVRGDEGFFHYRGHDATVLARTRRLEEVWHLLALGHLPDAVEVTAFTGRLAAWRERVPADLVAATHRAARSGADTLTTLRTAWSAAATPLGARPWLDLAPAERLDQALGLAAIGPVLVAAGHRAGVADDLASAPAPTAAAYLHLLTGATPPAAHVRALERYLVATIDHGLNASTFTARVVASTGADLAAVLVAALGALSGPLHGGAPSRALDMLDAIGTPGRAEAWVADALARGERIMGFGHRIYRTEDPRAALLRETARDLGGDRFELALAVETTVRELLRRHRPDRVLDVNVEYWAAVVLDAVGVPRPLFTPTFAVSRAIGWMAHALEQTEHNRIMRPSSRYVGAFGSG
ncbi:citrate synthase [Egicoccus sp. AB-alg2]|uniref:citrate synthase n=1 Tax=Egicoccus sp. AB-alg2 TaxID=3242693 RepID=UPI00359E800D